MIYKTLKKLKKFKKAVDRKKIRWYYIRALAVTKLSVKYTRSSGVVVNMPYWVAPLFPLVAIFPVIIL